MQGDYCAYHSVTQSGAFYANMPDMSAHCYADASPNGDSYADNIMIYLDHVQRHLGMIEALRGLQGTKGTATT